MEHEVKIGEIIASNKKFLFMLFILAFVIRAAVFIGYLGKNENYWQVDSQTYHLVAQQVAQGNGLVSADGSPHFYRLPGYPVFLGFFYYLFGVDTKKVLWPQIVVASAIPILVFLLSMILFPGALIIAKCASLWTVFHLGFILFAGFFMTESLFIFLFLLFLIFFFSGRYLFWAGTFLGLASLFRPVGHYLLVLAGIMLIFSHDWLRHKIIKFATLAGAWLIPVSFWLIRNFVLTGYLFFHTLPGGHFLYLSAARVAMHTQNCSYQEARQHLHDEVHQNLAKKEAELGRPLFEIESCNVHEQLAIKYFKQSPLIALKNWCTDMFRTMFSLHSAELLYLDAGHKTIDYFKKERSGWNMFERYLFPQTESSLLRVIVWSEIFLFILMLIGFLGYMIRALLCALRGKRESLVNLGKCLPFIALFIVIALSGGYARMRLPIEPLAIILSMAGWFGLKKSRRRLVEPKSCMD